MKILAIIPARGGSKGVPQKNIKNLNEKPLIAYTINTALKSNVLSHVLVSTDDYKIRDVALEFGADVPFLREPEFATDHAPAIPMLKHVLINAERYYNISFDAVLMLQPTSPFKTVFDIDNSINMLLETSDADSVISVVSVGAYHPARMKFIRNGVLIDPEFCEAYENQPRQELEPMYIRNGAIYLVRRNTLIINNSLKGRKSLAYLMPPERSINIDTFEDFEKAEELMSKL